MRYNAWNGTTNSRVSDSDITNYLGVGIVSFNEPDDEVEIESHEFEYRVDTDVYTSISVTGGRHTPDNPITVIFNIKNTSYTVSNIVYPDGASQLVWVNIDLLMILFSLILLKLFAFVLFLFSLVYTMISDRGLIIFRLFL